MSRRVSILVLLAAALLGAPLVALAKDNPRPRDGEYNVSVAGYFKGQGAGTVAGDKIKLQMTVTAENGAKGDLIAPGLAIVANHFSGSGTALGQAVTFEGRLDAPDQDLEKSIRGVRLVGTVKTADGRYSRLVGFIPALAKTPDKIDDEDRDRDRGRSRGR
jgi:hypothetical protein